MSTDRSARASATSQRCTENDAWLRVLTSSAADQVREMVARGLPPVALLFLHNACESRCYFCATAGVTDPAPESITRTDDVLRWIEGARDVVVERVCIGGTEPALHPAFESALRALGSRGVPIEVMTSGLRLGEPGVARRWRDLGVRALAVPLYSATSEVHDAIVGTPAALERISRGLDAARAAGIEVFVHTLALTRTLPELDALATMTAHRWGSRLAIGVSRPKAGVWSWDAEAPTLLELERAIADLDVSLVGFPRCVSREKPRASATVIDLYFRTTRTVFGDACADCLDRARCPGVLAEELGRGVTLRPRT